MLGLRISEACAVQIENLRYAGGYDSPLRDMQYAMRHAYARTTMRHDMARANLDRHAAHSVAAYLAGMTVG